MNDIFADSFDRLLAGECPATTVRKIESGESFSRLWNALTEGGFADLLVSESVGGAGLSLLDASPLIAACGRYALPVPLAYTMLVRALLDPKSLESLTGPITISASVVRHTGDVLRCDNVPFGQVSEWVMVEESGLCHLWSLEAAFVERDGVEGSLDASVTWSKRPRSIPLSYNGTRIPGATITAMLISGAMERVLEMTIAYANERSQFGRAIAKFQAIQQQVSVLAELTFATRMASRLACSPSSWTPSIGGAAVAKAYASQAAAAAAGIAHAVHGAIGITAEHDLHLYTRRLHAWRRAFGAETAWHEEIGAAWLGGNESALDFVRSAISPNASGADSNL
ncbi:UNVERIFIED_ORG: hypothetical protein J2Y81_007898 [Paraburkholderia sediminicola]|nr:hypothetical protein [Paraburkholderia sediminicola]